MHLKNLCAVFIIFIFGTNISITSLLSFHDGGPVAGQTSNSHNLNIIADFTTSDCSSSTCPIECSSCLQCLSCAPSCCSQYLGLTTLVSLTSQNQHLVFSEISDHYHSVILDGPTEPPRA